MRPLMPQHTGLILRDALSRSSSNNGEAVVQG